MIKKLCKYVLITLAVVAVLAAAALFTLYKMYPPEKLKTMAQEYVAQNFQRELTFDRISFTWIGFTLTNAALSENTTFENGTFIKADTLTAHVAVKPLLKKRIEISTIEADGLQVNLIKQQDGRFNFDTLLPAQASAQPQPEATPAPTTEEVPLVLTAEQIRLAGCDIVYQDNQTGLRTAVKDLNITINRFDLANPFEVQISFTTDVSGLGQPEVSVPVRLAFTAFLADLHLAEAYVTLTQAVADYQTVQFKLNGDVKNLEAPSVNLTGTLTGITSKVLVPFAPDLPNFSLPTLYLSLQARADLAASTAQITQAKLAVQDSALTASGTVDWGKAVAAYNLAAALRADIGQLVTMTDSLDSFHPGGVITANLKATEKKNNTDVRGTVTLQNLSAYYEPVTLTQTSGTVTLTSLDNIASSGITGKLNDQNFKASFSYQNVQDVLNLVLNFNLDKLVLKTLPSSSDSTANAAAAQTDTTPNAASTTRMNVQADVNIGGIEMPYLQAQGFTLTANLTRVTDTMSHANGVVSFELKPGQITNLDNFVKDSKIAKILLLPVAVVKKVAGFLQLDLFPAQQTATGAAISFTEGAGQYTFTDGVMHLDKTVFNSSVTQISATGTANFQTEALNMKATATLLTQAAPVAIKITGTLSEPKGKLDVVNTVTSVVGGLLNGTAAKSAAQTGATAAQGTAKLATDTVKETVDTATGLVKGIGSLFKKKTAD